MVDETLINRVRAVDAGVAELLFLTDVNSMGLDVAAGQTSMVGWYGA